MMDVFGYLKVIGVSDVVRLLFDKVGVELDDGVIGFDDVFVVVVVRWFYDCEVSLCDLV